MANERERDDVGLDRLFSDARSEQPGADLTARVLADAARVQAAAGAAQSGAGASAGRATGADAAVGGWFGGVVAALGGWGGVSGVTLAGITGLALGFWVPEAVDTMTGGQIWALSGGGAVTPDLTDLAMEGGDV